MWNFYTVPRTNMMRSVNMDISLPQKRLLRTRTGGYRSLAAFQLSTIIYDATVEFCEDHIDLKSRLVDQMIQAARSGRQNIAEGSRIGSTSPESERHLINVARASLEELLLDYEDYLRQKRLPQWESTFEEAIKVRTIWRDHYRDSTSTNLSGCNWRNLDDKHRQWYSTWLDRKVPAAIRANTLICLIHQASYRLDTMLFPKEDFGGTEKSPCSCGICGSLAVVRTVKNGHNKGQRFWG